MSLPLGAFELTVERQQIPSRLVRMAAPTASVAFGLLVGALIIWAAGQDPILAYTEMARKGFGGRLALTGTLVLATPLILTGLAAAVAFRMKIWNIGAEGQLILGAVASSGLGLWLGDNGIGGPVGIVLMLAAGALAGALWAALAALPRAYLNTDEVISTLMLNFVALGIMNYLIFSSFSHWRDPSRATFPVGRFLDDSMFLHRFTGRLHIGLFIALAAAGVLWWALRSTRWGFEVWVTGDSPRAALYSGMRVDRKILSVLMVSGAFAGLGGGIEVGGVLGNLDPRALSLGVGFAGIVVAALARLSPLGVIPVAILVASFTNAKPGLQVLGIPSEIVTLLEGILFLCIVGGEWFLRNALRLQRRAAGPVEVEAAPS
ncbi:MAG: ABC transporter permease [Acidimicrobiaceae bacterium]|nr:ABC transporter permease [Acidimicrobiaceae bacterium]MYL03114.1 ABC transporter permease [Acidimicrobiaceae bacterium]